MPNNTNARTTHQGAEQRQLTTPAPSSVTTTTAVSSGDNNTTSERKSTSATLIPILTNHFYPEATRTDEGEDILDINLSEDCYDILQEDNPTNLSSKKNILVRNSLTKMVEVKEITSKDGTEITKEKEQQSPPLLWIEPEESDNEMKTYASLPHTSQDSVIRQVLQPQRRNVLLPPPTATSSDSELSILQEVNLINMNSAPSAFATQLSSSSSATEELEGINESNPHTDDSYDYRHWLQRKHQRRLHTPTPWDTVESETPSYRYTPEEQEAAKALSTIKITQAKLSHRQMYGTEALTRLLKKAQFNPTNQKDGQRYLDCLAWQKKKREERERRREERLNRAQNFITGNLNDYAALFSQPHPITRPPRTDQAKPRESAFQRLGQNKQ
jgi:hypothetical protein